MAFTAGARLGPYEITPLVGAGVMGEVYRAHDTRLDSGHLPLVSGIDMAKVYLISCRDAGVDCDFQARGSTLEEVMQLCAEHGAREHNMKAFGPELYTKMRRCVKTLEEGTSEPTS